MIIMTTRVETHSVKIQTLDGTVKMIMIGSGGVTGILVKPPRTLYSIADCKSTRIPGNVSVMVRDKHTGDEWEIIYPEVQILQYTVQSDDTQSRR